MRYWHADSDLVTLSRHLRNKNLALLPKRPGLLDRGLGRAFDLLTQLRLVRLRQAGFQLVVSEQIVENALVLTRLCPSDRKILDFGGCESVLPLQLSALGYEVTVLDQRTYPFSHPRLRSVSADLFSPLLPFEDKFDVIVSISTIEHLGLGAYGDQVAEAADGRGVAILWSLLNDNHGRLLASVPAGKPAVQRGYRVYDEERLREVFPHATSIEWFKKDGREATWHQVEPQAVRDLEYSEPLGLMPVEAIAFVTCDKRPRQEA